MTTSTQSTEGRTTLTASSATRERDASTTRRTGQVVLASGRRVSVDRGRDFAALIRASQGS
jgi:hypothetical protein